MTAAEDKNPWLRLARISRDHAENKRLWNGYQKYLLRPNTHEYQRQMENPKFVDIVDLSDAEIHSIQTEIPDLPKEMVWFNRISLSTGIAEIKTDLTSDGFYFAFAVFIQNTTSKGLLTLEHAQFAAGLSAIECVFENDLNAIGASFGSFTMFMECRFIERTYFQGAKFETANFDQAKFNDICAFDNAKFAGRAFFTDSIFTNSANFDSVEFHDVTSFDLAAASSAAVSLSFKDAKFFEHPPRFFGRALHEDTDWTGVKLPNAEAQAAPPRYLLEDDKRAY